ncbi:MAG: hypothetical protein ACKVT1_09210 [Dehalococcoidia bacterium]
MRRERRAEPWWIQWPSAVLVVAALVGTYVLLLRLNIDLTRVESRADGDHRDLVYLVIHGSILAGGAIAGFLLGKWLSGLGVAYAALVLTVLCIAMVGTQVGSRALACQAGRNDIVRHWTC